MTGDDARGRWGGAMIAAALLTAIACSPKNASAPIEPTLVPPSTAMDAGDPSQDADSSAQEERCELEDDAAVLPCEKLRPGGRPRHSIPDYPREIAALEQLLERTPLDATDRPLLLRRLAADNLEFGCMALRECVRAQLDHRPLPGAARILKTGAQEYRRYCEQLRAEHHPTLAPCD